MQEGDQEEEPLPLFYQVPLQRLVAWNRWWCITSRALLIANQKRYWGLVGNYLKEVVGIVNPHLARVRLTFGRGPWQTAATVERLCSEVAAGELLCI